MQLLTRLSNAIYQGLFNDHVYILEIKREGNFPGLNVPENILKACNYLLFFFTGNYTLSG